MNKLYLAGPGIFRADAKAYGENLKAECRRYGFEGLFPLDPEVDADTPREMAAIIRAANLKLLRQSDYVIADLSPFRGPEPDSGTVWEVGFACALGKPVIAYSTDLRSQREKTIELLGLPADANTDQQGMKIEDFSLSHNLMFADLVRHGDFAACLEEIHLNGAEK